MKPLRLWSLCLLVLLAYFGLVYWYLHSDGEDDVGSPYARRSRPIIREPDTFDPVNDCVTPFGTLLGIANNTPAYSNCATPFQSKHVSFFCFANPLDTAEPVDPLRRDRVMTAFRWISVEYVMRWMGHNRGVMPLLMEDVSSMWEKDYFYNPAKLNQEWDAEYIINYNEAHTPETVAYTRPRVGDLIIYTVNAEKKFLNGHIAVITAMRNDIEGAGGVERYKELARRGTVPRILYLAEQNYDNKPWAQANYSRVAFFRWKETPGQSPEGYIEDDSGLTILGRMRVGSAREPRQDPDRYAQAQVQAENDEQDL